MSMKSLVEDLHKEGRRDRDTSRSAAQKLGEIGDKSVLKELEWARDNHKDKDTQNLARDAITKIRKRDPQSGSSGSSKGSVHVSLNTVHSFVRKSSRPSPRW